MSKNTPEEICALFTDHADAGRAQAMQAYMKDRFEYFGINSPTRKALCREYFKLAGYPGANELDEVVTELWSYDHREMQYVGVDLIRRYIRKLPEDFIDTIEALILKKILVGYGRSSEYRCRIFISKVSPLAARPDR